MLPPIAPVTGGEFEFSRVPPGSYNVRVAPGTTPPVRIDVEDKDIDIDNIELVGGLFAFGRVAVDDGSPIPLLAAAVAAGVPDAPSMIQVQANRPGMAGVAARNLARKDGFFLLPFGANSGPGEYLITATPIPIGYYLKSITSGTTDLLRSPLKLVKPLFTEIHVVLTRTPPPGTPAGVTVSGRVTQLENARPGAPVFVSMQSAASATNDTVMTAEEPVNPDGTFQIRGVPPGRYVVRSIPPSVVTTQTVEVAGVDVKGLEFSLRAPGAPSVGGTVTQISTSLIGGSGLRFTQSGRGPAYTEGAVTFFLVLRDNKPIIDVRLETSASVALPAGSYALRSYVRPCDGNCALLNAPRDECATTFTLETSQILAAERVMEGARCTIRITNSR
jgi:hypothetical protein